MMLLTADGAAEDVDGRHGTDSDVDGLVGSPRNPQRSSQIVAGPSGYDTQADPRPHHVLSDMVHVTIAADGDDA